VSKLTKGPYVCLFVCLSARTSQKPHAQISRNFLYMLSVAVARSSSNDSAIRYVLPVLCMTSRFHTMERMGQNQTCYVSSSWPDGGTGTKLLPMIAGSITVWVLLRISGTAESS